jgi:hypothetical protein
MKTLILGAIAAAMLLVVTPTDSEARPRRYYRNVPGPTYRTYYRPYAQPYAYGSYYRGPGYYRPYANRYYGPRAYAPGFYRGPGVSIGVY